MQDFVFMHVLTVQVEIFLSDQQSHLIVCVWGGGGGGGVGGMLF